MSSDILDREARSKVWGLVIGIVTSNSDDDSHTTRIRVRFPMLEGGGASDKVKHSSALCRVATFMAGGPVGDDTSFGPRGALFHPEIGDEVIVAFVHGDIKNAVILGRVWSDVAPDKQGGQGRPAPPIYSHTNTKGKLAGPSDGASAGPDTKVTHEKGKNDLSGIVTRSGHVLSFNDNAAGGAVYLRSKDGHRIDIVDGGKKGILLADSDGNYVHLKSGSASGDIEIKTKGNITLDAEKDITLKAGKSVTVKSGTETTLKAGTSFTAKSSAGMTLDSGASTLIKASGGLKLSGNPININ